MINKVIFQGRVTKDIEVRATQGGKHYARFTLANNRGKSKDGKDLGADFVSCIAWENRADFIKQYFNKGDEMIIVGKLNTGSYEDNGRTIYTTDVIAEEISFTSGKQKSDTNVAPVPVKEESTTLDVNFDDLPF